MEAREVVRKIKEIGIVPVVRASSADEACRVVDAICAGGIPIIEITMTVPNATAVIREIVRCHREAVLIGAGTVVNAAQAAECLDAGAQFLVSPGLSASVIAVARSRNKLAIPGALTPSEVMQASEQGVNLLKIFPCSSAGGPKHISSLKSPFPSIDFIPTGGVILSNAEEYLRAGSFALGVGADLVDVNAVRAGNTQKIVDAAKALVAIVAKFRNADSASKAAKSLRPASWPGSPNH
jgi:2-dehydro-3-deoxyphosphogluconate aldolase / (4S)-4-hydroxy-2-oxoglutarate aldolase